jgi:hypothetical protein
MGSIPNKEKISLVCRLKDINPSGFKTKWIRHALSGVEHQSKRVNHIHTRNVFCGLLNSNRPLKASLSTDIQCNCQKRQSLFYPSEETSWQDMDITRWIDRYKNNTQRRIGDNVSPIVKVSLFPYVKSVTDHSRKLFKYYKMNTTNRIDST